jgi:hypothetical protein
MKNPPHPGDLIRTEIIEELGLTVKKAAEILKVRRASMSLSELSGIKSSALFGILFVWTSWLDCRTMRGSWRLIGSVCFSRTWSKTSH